MGFYEGEKEVGVGADFHHFDFAGVVDCHDSGVCGRTIYIRIVLIQLKLTYKHIYVNL